MGFVPTYTLAHLRCLFCRVDALIVTWSCLRWSEVGYMLHPPKAPGGCIANQEMKWISDPGLRTQQAIGSRHTFPRK